jgi:electron transport complex protein RnfG
MRDFVKMTTVLFIVCGLSAGSLAVMNAVTKERIATAQQRQREAALREVFPDADEFKNVTPDKVWEASRNGQKVGQVFLAQTRGYSGPISLMFGTGLDGAITGVRVLTHTETPGLGAKIAKPAFRDQFKDKRREQLALKKDDPAKGRIDTITGATISSRAVMGAISSTLDSFEKEKTGGDK